MIFFIHNVRIIDFINKHKITYYASQSTLIKFVILITHISYNNFINYKHSYFSIYNNIYNNHINNHTL